MNEKASFDISQIPEGNRLPAAKHPIRHVINGDMHLIPELKKIVTATDIPDSLKEFIGTELDGMTSTGASVHLHFLDLPNGGVALHLSLMPVHLGARPGKPVTAALAKETEEKLTGA